MDMFSNYQPLRTIKDSGATGNMVQRASVRRIGARIMDTSQSARQPDGSSRLNMVGETRLTLEGENTTYYFECLVVEDFDTEILGGVPLRERNELSVRPGKSEIWIGDIQIRYSSTTPPANVKRVRRTHVLRSPHWKASLARWIFWTLDIWQRGWRICHWALLGLRSLGIGKDSVATYHYKKRRRQGATCQHYKWTTTNTKITISLSSGSYVHSGKNFWSSKCQSSSNQTPRRHDSEDIDQQISSRPRSISALDKHSIAQADSPIKGKLKGLQLKFYELERVSVFAESEALGIAVEYVNLSFLVNKTNHSHRLVTAFSSVGCTSKPQSFAYVKHWLHAEKDKPTAMYHQNRPRQRLPSYSPTEGLPGVLRCCDPFRSMRL